MNSNPAAEMQRTHRPLLNSQTMMLYFSGPFGSMMGCFLVQRATGPGGIRHAKPKHNLNPSTEMNNNRLVNRFA